MEDRAHPPLPESVRAPIEARYGRRHVHTDFNPARAALVVVDMQRAFLRPSIGYVPCEAARAAIPIINRLAAAFRDAGQPVFWLQNIHDPAMQSGWSNMYATHGPTAATRRAQALSPASPGFALDDALDVDLSDQVLVKRRYSAFFPNTCDLPEKLRASGIETVVLAGTTTDVCVESTARDAMMHNYRVIVVEDATGALTDAAHHNALGAMAMHFADVMPAEMVLGRLRNSGTHCGAAA